ncbi:MAG: alpha/beta fold hydrolase [Pararhodobacter sp.]|nr:alpha/beta fold hydrolase [Pararhodobacter sp.]
MPSQRIQIHRLIPADPAAIWAVARDFCGLWHPAMASCREERDARGALIRAFTVHGEETLYREQLTWFSDSDRSLGYTHLQGIEGCERYDARLTVSPAKAGGSAVTWSAEITAPAARIKAIASGTEAVFAAGIEALASAPAPETAPAPLPAPASHAPLVLDDLPRLALSVTPAPAGREDTMCLFLHGIGGQRDNWDAQLGLAGTVMRAAAMDLRGYGGSGLGSRQSTIDDYCDDIARVADHFGAARLVLAGLSYGSWIATSFAMRHPGRLAGLVLSGGCTGMSEAGPDEREAFRISREVPLNAGQVPADFAPAVVKAIAGPNADAAMREALLQSMASIQAETYRDALNCFTNPLERFDFSRLTMPVLMMTGEHDRLAPPEEIRAVAGRIWDSAHRPDLRFEVIEGAGHVCNLEAPEQYNRHLLAFLRKLAP